MATTRHPISQLDVPANVPPYERDPQYGSDVAVDVLRALNMEYVALNPGASYRGLHDSLVNYGGNRTPQMILCLHEEVAVAIAHGYYKATGRMMGAILHNIVGLQHGSMGIFDAWCDRVPIMVMGGTGPMDVELRRPWIDWIHTALVQGNQVRDYTKWDDQPATVGSIADSLLRAYRLAVTEPCGPVYVCFDGALQEMKLDQAPTMPDVTRYAPAAPIGPNAAALEEAARLLASAQRPAILADRAGRYDENVTALVSLAETVGAAVVDKMSRLNFPTDHPLNLTGADAEILAEADVVLAVDMVDLHGAISKRAGGRASRRVEPATEAKIINISLDELLTRGWATDFQRLPPVDVPLLADSRAALPALQERCAALLQKDSARGTAIAARRKDLADRQARMHERWREYHKAHWGDQPTSRGRVAAELWSVLKDEDWVLASGGVMKWAPGIWTVTKGSQYLGESGGGGLGYGPGGAVGAALGLKDSGKLPVSILGDGDFLMASSALWTAAHYQLPLLMIIYDNRSFFNDEEHQRTVADMRSRPRENAWVGQRIEEPVVDLPGIARCYDLHGEGPIFDPTEIAPAIRRALKSIKEDGRAALVDIVAQEGLNMAAPQI
jgi:acetolactate synthase I/II/III large subunit